MKRFSSSLFVVAIACALASQFPATAIAETTETVIHSFGSGKDGAPPNASLIDVSGTLYGTTYYGGAHKNGTVFAIDETTGAETVLYSFCSQKNCKDGQRPEASLIDVNGILYGTTWDGGARAAGAVFAVDEATGAETVLYSFCKRRNQYNWCLDGSGADASLINVNGTLYGTTINGGTKGNEGTVFALDPSTGAETVVYSFVSGTSDGYNPRAGLIDVKGTLYGTTGSGGVYKSLCGNQGCGTVFSLDPTTGAEKVLYSFCSQKKCSDGIAPYAAVIDVNGTLYGTTKAGGTHGYGGGAIGYGTVFAINETTGAATVLHSFRGGKKDGASSFAGVIDVKGTLYGTTYNGGTSTNDSCEDYSCGTVFAINETTGAESVLYSFGGSPDGSNPIAGLIDVNGTLYGTSPEGGAYDNRGTAFAVTP